MKSTLRTHNTALLISLMTSGNQNNYHSKLANNLLTIIEHLDFPKNKECITIGSYINKAITEIIPPHLSLSQSYDKSKLTSVNQFSYCYPVFNANTRDMKFYKHLPNLQYEKGSFGIKILRDLDQKLYVKNVDIMIVPLLGFTKQKHRLGRGGGYYDNYINNSRKMGSKTVFIGVGFQALKVSEHGIIDSWDEALDYVITQQNIY